jgi:hypothetical protein
MTETATLTEATTIWGVTSYDLGGNAGFVVEALFTSRAAAEEFAAYRPDDYDVEEFDLYDRAPAQWHYYTAIASIFPDGTYEEHFDTHTAEGRPCIKPLDERDLFDGHMQSHCGLHLYVSGTDKARVSAAFAKKLKRGIEASTGTCSCGRTELFQRGFMDDPLRDKERAECAKTHGEGYCKNCGTFTVRFSTTSKDSTDSAS